MDDAYVVSVTPDIAVRIRENVQDLRVETENIDGRGFTLIVDDRAHRCEVPTNCTIELWKSLDGFHSLKSIDMQRVAVNDVQLRCPTLDKAQHCELADPSSGVQSLNVEGDIFRLSTSHAASKATTLVEYVATIEEVEGFFERPPHQGMTKNAMVDALKPEFETDYPEFILESDGEVENVVEPQGEEDDADDGCEIDLSLHFPSSRAQPIQEPSP